MFLAAAALLLAFVLGASFASASAWEAFETRCLGPMERIASPVTEGLVQRPSPLSDSVEGHYGGDAWFPDEGDFALMLTGKPVGCLVLTDADDGSVAQSAAWLASAMATDRYMPGSASASVLSHLWREPVLEVMIRHDGGFVIFAAIETDMES